MKVSGPIIVEACEQTHETQNDQYYSILKLHGKEANIPNSAAAGAADKIYAIMEAGGSNAEGAAGRSGWHHMVKDENAFSTESCKTCCAFIVGVK